MDIRSLMTTDIKAQAKENAKLVKKWEETGLLEGLNKYESSQMARMLENQLTSLITEANKNSTGAGSEEWNDIALPLVRRVWQNVVTARDFMSTQAMSKPTGLVFYLDHKYATAQTGFTTGSARTSQEDSIYGVTDARRGADVATGGLYGPGRFGYSINDQTQSVNISTVTSINGTAAAIAAHLNYNSDLINALSAKIAADEVVKVVVPTAALTNFDKEGVRAFTIAHADIAYHLSQYTTLSSDTTTITFVCVLDDGGEITLPGEQACTIGYHRQPTDITRGDFEDQLDGNALDIPEIDIQLRSEEIVAKTRKLKAKWTPEFSQDLNAYHDLDPEEELTGILTEYISKEIDLELLDMLIKNAQTTSHWSAKIGFEYASGAFAQTSANASAYNQGTWFQTLGTKIQKVSNAISKLTMRGGANFIVTSPEVATILESIPGYAAATAGDSDKFEYGASKVGAINNRWTVYKNPYFTENIMLVGYKGSSFLETGAVYSPYVPLISTPVVLDPDNFTPRKGVMTRYAKKMLRPEFYGVVYIDGLDTI